jgi:hypothetical protein
VDPVRGILGGGGEKDQDGDEQAAQDGDGIGVDPEIMRDIYQDDDRGGEGEDDSC